MQVIRGQPDWVLSDRQHHEAYSGGTALLKELPLVGQMHLLDALRNSMVPHTHPGIYEAHLVIEGSMGIHIDEQDYEVGAGSVFLTRPDELHGSIDGSLRPAKWYWIHLHIPREHALPGLSVSETRDLARAYQRVVLRTFPGSEGLRECFRRLMLEHRHPEAHGQTVARAILHELMVMLIRDHDRAVCGVKSLALSPEVQRAITWLNRHLGEPLSIPDIAESSGLGQSHFRQRFHKETGFTPSDYLTRQRVLRAKDLLRNARGSVTEIAFRLGFQSSPYFAAVFKKITGMTPSEYRAGTALVPGS
jgi:AraC-like DNA-binding protein